MKTPGNSHDVGTGASFSEVPYLNLCIIEISNPNMNDSIYDISLMDKLAVLRKAHSGSSMNDIAQEIDVSIPRVQSIISQRSRITK